MVVKIFQNKISKFQDWINSVGITGGGSVIDGWGILALGGLWLREVEGRDSQWVVDVAVVGVVVIVGQGLGSGVSGDLASSGVISENVFHIVGVFLSTGKSGVPELRIRSNLLLGVETSSWVGVVGLKVGEDTLEGGEGVGAGLVRDGLELARGVEGIESWEVGGGDCGNHQSGVFHLLIRIN